MDALLRQVLRQLRGVWRFHWTAGIVAWLVALIGWAVVLVLPDQYEAEAKVYVDTDSLAREALGRMIVEGDVQARVELVRQMMLSRTQLEAVARDTDLDLRAPTPKEFENLVKDLQTEIKVTAVGDSRKQQSRGRGNEQIFYRISYRDVNRKTAENVVGALLDSMVEGSLMQASNESVKAVKFLQDQVAEYSERLNDAERKLSDFRREHVGMLPGEGGDYFARLQNEMEDLRKVQNELAVARDRRDALKNQLASARRSPTNEDGSTAVSPAADLERQINEQELQLNQLLLLYTDKHPDVIATRQTLELLRERLAALGESPDNAPMGEIVVQNVQIALNQAEVEVASLEGQVAQHQATVDELQRRVDTIPEVERQYGQLTRDYGVFKAQYQNLLESLENASLTKKMGTTGDDVEFRVVERPRAGLEPVAPDRPQLLVLTLAVALASGIGLAWLRNELNPVFISRQEVYEDLGRPVLGSVSMTWSPRQVALRRTEHLSFIAVSVLLFVSLGVVFLVQQPMTRLAQKLIW